MLIHTCISVSLFILSDKHLRDLLNLKLKLLSENLKKKLTIFGIIPIHHIQVDTKNPKQKSLKLV